MFLGLASNIGSNKRTLSNLGISRVNISRETGTDWSGRVTSLPLMHVVHRLLAVARTRFHNLRVSRRALLRCYRSQIIVCSGGRA